jgi:hypothetical protein
LPLLLLLLFGTNCRGHFIVKVSHSHLLKWHFLPPFYCSENGEASEKKLGDYWMSITSIAAAAAEERKEENQNSKFTSFNTFL